MQSCTVNQNANVNQIANVNVTVNISLNVIDSDGACDCGECDIESKQEHAQEGKRE